MAPELVNREIRIGEMPVHKLKFVAVNDMAAQALCLHRVFATAATGLLARSFHLKALLRDRVLPAMDGGEWIRRIDRSS
jgi:hypothetical protein